MSYNRWNTYSDELYHYGVKGMRWGVRKDSDSGYNVKKLKSDLNRASEVNLRSKRAFSVRKYEKIYATSPLKSKDPRIKAMSDRSNEIAKERDAIVKDTFEKAKRHLRSTKEQQQRIQNEADRAYREANSSSNEKRARRKNLRKADKLQKEADRLAREGKEFYDELVRETSMQPDNKYRRRSMYYDFWDKDLRNFGKEFVSKVGVK